MKNKIINFLVIFIQTSMMCNAQQFDWAKSYGGHVSDFSKASVVDSEGNVIIGVNTSGLNVVKYDTSGNIKWFFNAGTSLEDMAIDIDNNIYLVGGQQGIASLTKLDSLGNFKWVKSYTVSRIKSIYIDKYGEIYLAGNYKGIIYLDSIRLESQKGSYWHYQDIFITKLNSQGNVIWAKSFGGVSDDYAYCIQGDESDNLYLAGAFSPYKAKFDTIDYNLGYSAPTDFIMKMDDKGQLEWIRNGLLASNSISEITDISIDDRGNINCIGGFYGTVIYGNDTLISKSEKSIYYLKYDSNGNVIKSFSFNSYSFQRFINGAHSFGSIVSDSKNNIYIASLFTNTIFIDTIKHTSRGQQDIFLAKFNEIGYPQWVRQIGGERNEFVSDISLGKENKVYLTGDYCSLSLNLDAITIFNNSGNGDEDIYLIALSDTLTENKCPEIGAQIISEFSYLCEGDSLKLECKADYGDSFTWLKQDSIISCNYDSQIWVKDPGAYSVIVNNAFICPDTSEVVEISIRSLPHVRIEAFPDTIICTNEIIDLSVNNNSQYVYQWFNNGMPMNIDSSVLKVSSAGKYKCILYDNYCFNEESINIISGVPIIKLHSRNDTILCPNEEMIISFDGDSSYQYTWYKNDTILNFNTSNINIQSSGIYKIIVDNSLCTYSDSLKIVDGFTPNIVIPTDTVVLLDTFVTIDPIGDSGNIFRWYKSGKLWPIGYSKTIDIYEAGSYFVYTYNSCGSDVDSVQVIDFITILSETKHQNVIVYPNPNSGLIYLKLPGEYSNNFIVSIFNSSGVIVYHNTNLFKDEDFSIDLSGYPTGNYLLVIETEKDKVTKQIILK